VLELVPELVLVSLLVVVLVLVSLLVLVLVLVSLQPLLTLLLVVQSLELVPEPLLEPVVESLQLLELVLELDPVPVSLGTMLLVELSDALAVGSVELPEVLPEEPVVLPESLQPEELLLSVELLEPVPEWEWLHPPESVPVPEPMPVSLGMMLPVELSDELDVELAEVLELLPEEPLPELEWWQPPESPLVLEVVPLSPVLVPGPSCETPVELPLMPALGPLFNPPPGPGGGPPWNPPVALGTSRRSSCSISSRKVRGFLARHAVFFCPRPESHFQTMLTSPEKDGTCRPGVVEPKPSKDG
jgi:hypothetical protein